VASEPHAAPPLHHKESLQHYRRVLLSATPDRTTIITTTILWMITMTMMTIPSSETAFTATLRRHPDRQKTRTPTLLLPRVCRCHATTVALLFAMVRVYHLLFYYYSHLVFYDVLCIATVQILFILETQTNTYINIMLSASSTTIYYSTQRMPLVPRIPS